MKIDEEKFLKLLQNDARMSMAEMAKNFGVTETAARKKLKKFEESEIIVRYVAEINWERFREPWKWLEEEDEDE